MRILANGECELDGVVRKGKEGLRIRPWPAIFCVLVTGKGGPNTERIYVRDISPSREKGAVVVHMSSRVPYEKSSKGKFDQI